LIGDPSGRTTERPELAEKKVEDNLAGIRRNIESIFKNHEEFLWKDKGPKNLQPVM
jgi:tyrosyl-tRNA synthetase